MKTVTDRPVEQQLAYFYASFIDKRRFQALREIISPDFTQHSEYWQCEGADQFLKQLEQLQQYDATFHFVGNQLGEWQGETYQGETYCIASHFSKKEQQAYKMDMGIIYQDFIARYEGRYCYRSRNVKMLWIDEQPLTSPFNNNN